MSRRAWLALGLGVLAIAALAAALAGRATGAGASASSPGRLGWLAAGRYLELRDVEVILRDRPVDGPVHGATLVAAFPGTGGWAEAELEALDRHMLAGGTFVLAYSGRHDPGEARLARHLSVDLGTVRSNPYLHPLRWLAFERDTWELAAADPGTPAPQPVVVTAPHEVPRTPVGARVLLRGPGGEAAAFVVERGRGALVVLPAEALANCRLSTPGNGDLLESLAAVLPGPWELDEYRHGLVSGEAGHATPSARAFDALLLHLGLCYLLGVLALARRAGPPWRETLPPTGSVVPFLLGLGHLHDRLRHHHDASAAMLRHAAELDPRLDLTGLEPVPPGKRAAAGLVELARTLAARQRRRPGPPRKGAPDA